MCRGGRCKHTYLLHMPSLGLTARLFFNAGLTITHNVHMDGPTEGAETPVHGCVNALMLRCMLGVCKHVERGGGWGIRACVQAKHTETYTHVNWYSIISLSLAISIIQASCDPAGQSWVCVRPRWPLFWVSREGNRAPPAHTEYSLKYMWTIWLIPIFKCKKVP